MTEKAKAVREHIRTPEEAMQAAEKGRAELHSLRVGGDDTPIEAKAREEGEAMPQEPPDTASGEKAREEPPDTLHERTGTLAVAKGKAVTRPTVGEQREALRAARVKAARPATPDDD